MRHRKDNSGLCNSDLTNSVQLNFNAIFSFRCERSFSAISDEQTIGEGTTVFLVFFFFYLRTRELGSWNLPRQHAQKLVHEWLPHIVHFIPCAPCFHSHYCPLIVWWASMALLQGTCASAASALPPGLIAPTKLILLPQTRAHSIRDIFKHSCSFPPPSSSACVSCGI